MKKQIIIIEIILIIIIVAFSGCYEEKKVDTYVNFEFEFINNWNKTASIGFVWGSRIYLDDNLVDTILDPNNSIIKYSNHSHVMREFFDLQISVIDYYTELIPPEPELKNFRWRVEESGSLKLTIVVNENGKIVISEK